MAGRLDNIGNLFSNVRTRTIIILTMGILGLALIVGIIRLYKASESDADQTGTAGLARPPRQETIPGLTPTSEKYATMQKELSKQRIQEAQKTGGSAIPTAVYKGQNGVNGGAQGFDGQNPQGNLGVQGNPMGGGLTGLNTNQLTQMDQTPGQAGQAGQLGQAGQYGAPSTGAFANSGAFGTAGVGAGNSQNPQNVTPEQLQQMQAQLAQQQAQLAQLSDQQSQQNRQNTVASMQGQVQALLNAWNASPNQQYTEGQAAAAAGQQGQGAQGQGGAAGTQNSSTTTQTEAPQAPIMKAGDIIYAVLATELNSDEPGPIMATIVSGPYKGAKLIGSMRETRSIPGTNGPTAVVLNFNTINIPSETNSISINAVAIDPDTARTAIADEVDHHYMLRYGSLFASSFLEGYGTAVGQAGTSVTQNSDSSVFTTYPELSPKEEFAVGIGQVGQEWSNQLGDTFNRPNTIIVHAGTAMGILFLSDVQLGGAGAQQTTVLPPSTVSTGGSGSLSPLVGMRM